jgi:hypothetical protein
VCYTILDPSIAVRTSATIGLCHGAVNGTRTRNILLGRQTL